MATKTDSSFEGMRVTLLDGTKDRVAKVMKTGYKTKGGHTIKAANIAKKGRGLIETDAGGGGATPKSSSAKSNRRGASSSKKSSSKAAGSKAKSGKKDPANMTRRELVTELVNAEVLPTRSAAKGTGVDELREMVEDAMSGSSKKKAKSSKSESSAKVSRRRGKKTEESAKPKKEKRSPAKRERKSDRKVSKSKPVKVFNDKIARDLESHVEAHIADFLRECTGYDTTVACVGGVFNDERLTLQIGLLPANASDEEIEAYAADMEEAEESETGASASEDDLDEADGDVDVDELVEQLVDVTGQDEDKVRKAVEAYFASYDEVIEPKLGDEVQIGTRLDYEGSEAIVLGYSEKKGKMVLYVEEEDKMKLVPIVKVAGMEILEEEYADEEELDEEPLDMEEDDEEELDDEEDFDDEDEEDLEEEGDEEEDEDSDDDDFDDFDDFDDEL